MPINAASITTAKPVAYGAVPHRSAAVHSKIVCCIILRGIYDVAKVILLFEQHPYFVQCRSRASGCRRPCSSRIWSASSVGALPSFFRGGRRLYRSWTVHQCWCSNSTIDSFSLLILACVCNAYPAFVLHPRFSRKRAKSVRWF